MGTKNEIQLSINVVFVFAGKNKNYDHFLRQVRKKGYGNNGPFVKRRM